VNRGLEPQRHNISTRPHAYAMRYSEFLRPELLADPYTMLEAFILTHKSRKSKSEDEEYLLQRMHNSINYHWSAIR